MVSVDPELVEDLARHDEYYTARELVRYLERHHPVEGPGVPRELVEAYAEELEYDRDRLESTLDDQLIDAKSWQPGDRLYEVEGNVSIYPPSWHEELAGSTDLSKYVEVMEESVRASESGDGQVDLHGVEQGELITAAEILGDLDRDSVHERLRDQRVEGDIVLYAFQNPEEVVRLPEEDEE